MGFPAIAHNFVNESAALTNCAKGPKNGSSNRIETVLSELTLVLDTGTTEP